MPRAFHMNCAVLERTADGDSVGRCWFHLSEDFICPRHGNVRLIQERYEETGKCTDETSRQ